MQQLIPAGAGEHREKIEIRQIIVAYRGAQSLAEREGAELLRPRQKAVYIIARLKAEHRHARVHPTAQAHSRRQQHERVKAPLHNEQKHRQQKQPRVDERRRCWPIGVHTQRSQLYENAQRRGNNNGKYYLKPQIIIHAADEPCGKRHFYHPFRTDK